MTEHEIEKKVKKAFTSNLPNVLDNILSACGEREREATTMLEIKGKRLSIKWAAGIAAVFVLTIAGIFGAQLYRMNYSVDAVISLDVNPSVEIKANRNEKVLTVDALNEDGKNVIGETAFKGNDLEAAVDTLIASMLRNGYLNDAANSVLLSVYGENGGRAGELQKRLSEKIKTVLSTDAFGGAVLSQVVLPDGELQALADSYGISQGKARLIQRLITQQPQYAFADLVGLTINELHLLSKSGGAALEDIQSLGDVSDKAYIGMGKAREIAFAHAGVASESDVEKFEIEMDYAHNAMTYEVDFSYAGYRYAYKINASTGEITEAKASLIENKGQTAADPDQGGEPDKPAGGSGGSSASQPGQTAPPAAGISADRAREIAFSQAGVTSEGDVVKLQIKTDYEHNTMVYEVSFSYAGYEYEYEISAGTGEIIEADVSPIKNKEPDKTSSGSQHTGEPAKPPVSSGGNNAPKPEQTTSAAAGISAARAKEIAFARAGVTSEGDVTELEIETDYEHNTKVYEVSFSYAGYEYEYEINAGTGEITDEDRELIDD